MNKYKGPQFYKVEGENVSLQFDYFGEFQTDKKEEIELLDSLCPAYIKCVDKVKATPEPKKEENEEIKVEKKSEEKPKAKKSSDK